MAATIQDVRRRPLNDITEPYLFSDEDIRDALDDAAEILGNKGIDIDTRQGAKAQRLMAAKDLIADYLNRIKGRPATAVSEGSNSISFVDLAATRDLVECDLQEIMDQFGGLPGEVG